MIYHNAKKKRLQKKYEFLNQLIIIDTPFYMHITNESNIKKIITAILDYNLLMND